MVDTLLGGSSLQIDIIDKTDEPDGPFTCIGHFMDHCSRISILFPLKTSALEHLIPMLKERVLAYFGLPSILHTDNCPDLSVKGLKELVVDWPGDDDDDDGDNNDDDDDDDNGRGSDHDDGDDDGDNDDDDGGFGGEEEGAGLLRSALHPPHQQLP